MRAATPLTSPLADEADVKRTSKNISAPRSPPHAMIDTDDYDIGRYRITGEGASYDIEMLEKMKITQ